MYIKETFKNNTWIYLVTEKGLQRTDIKAYVDLWPWDAIQGLDFKMYGHSWEVLTEDEYFLEMI